MPGHKNLEFIRGPPSPVPPGRPPPDGETSQPTKAGCHHRQRRRSWRYGRHGRPPISGAQLSSDGRHEYRGWRRPGCGDDPSTAKNGWLLLYDETAGRVEAGQ